MNKKRNAMLFHRTIYFSHSIEEGPYKGLVSKERGSKEGAEIAYNQRDSDSKTLLVAEYQLVPEGKQYFPHKVFMRLK